jgi:hypothetical protein
MPVSFYGPEIQQNPLSKAVAATHRRAISNKKENFSLFYVTNDQRTRP